MLATIMATGVLLLWALFLAALVWSLCRMSKATGGKGYWRRPEPERGGEGRCPHVILGDDAQAAWIRDLKEQRAQQRAPGPFLRAIEGGADGLRAREHTTD